MTTAAGKPIRIRARVTTPLQWHHLNAACGNGLPAPREAKEYDAEKHAEVAKGDRACHEPTWLRLQHCLHLLRSACRCAGAYRPLTLWEPSWCRARTSSCSSWN